MADAVDQKCTDQTTSSAIVQCDKEVLERICLLYEDISIQAFCAGERQDYIQLDLRVKGITYLPV